MKVFLSTPPYKDEIEVFIGKKAGKDFHVVMPMVATIKRFEEGQQLPSEPSIIVSKEALLELLRSLTAECERLGLTRPAPSELEMKRIIDHRNGLEDTCKALASICTIQARALLNQLDDAGGMT